MKTKKVNFMGWKDCIEITSGKFKLVATTEIGPRIIGGFLGKSENIFCVVPETAGKTGGDEWNLYGGHRLWHAPEIKPRSYTLDNFPVDVETTDDGIRFSTPSDKLSGMTKSIEIIPLGKESFQIVHKMRNENAWDVEAALWALSVMAPGGVGVLPMPQGDKEALLPNLYMTLWPYNDMSDGRISIGPKYTLVRHNAKCKEKIKIGYNCEDGWIAYQNKGVTFVKKFEHVIGAPYPDNGCSVECFSCDYMQEMETLSPLYTLAPGEEAVHTETWSASELGNPVKNEKEAVKIFG